MVKCTYDQPIVYFDTVVAVEAVEAAAAGAEGLPAAHSQSSFWKSWKLDDVAKVVITEVL